MSPYIQLNVTLGFFKTELKVLLKLVQDMKKYYQLLDALVLTVQLGFGIITSSVKRDTESAYTYLSLG